MEGTQRITDDLDRLCRVAASSNKPMNRSTGTRSRVCLNLGVTENARAVGGYLYRYVVPTMLISRVLNKV